LNIYSRIAVATTNVILISCVLQAIPAQAASFEFSYRFLSGNTLSGTVDGDLVPDTDLIVNFTNLRAFYSGVPELTFSYTQRGAITFSGTFNRFFGFVNPLPAEPPDNFDNFGFGFTNMPPFLSTNSATVGFFIAYEDETGSGVSFPFGSNQLEAENFSPERWTLIERTIQPVPEPASLAGLLAFGALAVGSTLKHKFQAKNLG
jgi:hypothetical protein